MSKPATAEPPARNAPPERTDDILGFVPTNADDPAPPIEPDPEVIDPPIVPPAKAPEPAPGDDEFDINAKVTIGREEPPKPGPGRPKTSAIREQLEAVAAEKKTLEARLAAVEAEKAEAARLREQHEADAKTLREQLAAIQAESSGVTMDMRSPEVRAIADPWNNKAKDFADIIGDLGGEKEKVTPALMDAAKAMARLDTSTPEGQESLAEVRESLSAIVGRENMRDAMILAREGAQSIGQINALIEESKRNAPQILSRRHEAVYKQARKGYEEIERNMFNPSQELIEADPFNASVILGSMVKGSPEVATAAERVKEFARFVLLPPPPLTDATIDPEELGAKTAEVRERHTKAFKNVQAVLAEALLARQLLPGLWKRLENAEKVMKTERRIVAPKMNGEGERHHEEDEGEEEADMREFEPSPLPAL